MLGLDEQFDAARDAGLSADEAGAFESEHHLMDRRRGDVEVALHVGLGGRSADDQGIGVDEGQILALLVGEAGSRKAGDTRLISDSSVDALTILEGTAMNVRYRVELSQAEREQLTALLSGGKHAARKLKRAQILLAADAGASDEDDRQRRWRSAARRCTGPSAASCEGNLEAALSEEPRPGAARKLTGKEEALLVATACSSAARRPGALDAGAAGRRRWSS